MKKPVVCWKSALTGLMGVMVCALLMLAACDNPVGSDGTSDDGGSEQDEEDDDDVTVALYTITYLGNGAVSGEPPVDAAEYYGGQTIWIASQGDLRGAFIRDGITQCVTHWTTADDGSGDAYVPGSTTFMPDQNLTLYAQWSTDNEVIGKTGPTGGWIFYEDTEGTHSWAYLEAAPEDIVTDEREKWQWGAEGHDISGLSDVDDPVGSGLDDTEAVVQFHDSLSSTDGDNSSYYEYAGDFGVHEGFKDDNLAAAPTLYTFSTNNDGTVAAKLCTEYTAVSGGTTYDDWFLPSEAELAEMYNNLRDRDRPLGTFDQHGSYWSTNGYSDERAKAKCFYGTASEIAATKSSTYQVRPVRRFPE